eukprot:2607006-Ditylum_brightwellii.AAC.1
MTTRKYDQQLPAMPHQAPTTKIKNTATTEESRKQQQSDGLLHKPRTTTKHNQMYPNNSPRI